MKTTSFLPICAVLAAFVLGNVAIVCAADVPPLLAPAKPTVSQLKGGAVANLWQWALDAQATDAKLRAEIAKLQAQLATTPLPVPVPAAGAPRYERVTWRFVPSTTADWMAGNRMIYVQRWETSSKAEFDSYDTGAPGAPPAPSAPPTTLAQLIADGSSQKLTAILEGDTSEVVRVEFTASSGEPIAPATAAPWAATWKPKGTGAVTITAQLLLKNGSILVGPATSVEIVKP